MTICAAVEGDLAKFLRAERESLIASWERLVLEDPGVPEATRLPEPALRNDMPALIEGIASALERIDGRPVEDTEWAIGGAATAHALQRFGAGYTLEAALRELSHFRSAMADIFYEHAVMPSRSEFRLMSVTIDETVAIVAARMRDEEQARMAHVRERFVAVLGHDLRNPLNAITIGAAGLLRHQLPEREAAGVLRIARAAERMARMIADIYEFAAVRLAPTGLRLAVQRSNIAELCNEVIEEMRLLHGSRAIVFQPREEVCGIWDRNRILRVLSNLLGNALTHSPLSSEVRVGVTLRGERVVVSVHNDGEPIEAAILPLLFNPFARGGAAVNKADGLGLGLFIAREIALAHGGEIRVESTAERGTCFTLELPIGDAT